MAQLDALRLALAVLASYRLARLIALEEGPAGVLVHLREWAGAYDYGENGEPATNLGRGISCQLCVGVWAALPAAALALWPTRPGTAALAWLGIAGAQAFLTRLEE
ncbi:MAG: hypothetical protein QM346_18785 [Chloroflexota bacterium]|nr:hypothetical protein [Chloroflexota bacterium]